MNESPHACRPARLSRYRISSTARFRATSDTTHPTVGPHHFHCAATRSQTRSHCEPVATVLSCARATIYSRIYSPVGVHVACVESENVTRRQVLASAVGTSAPDIELHGGQPWASREVQDAHCCPRDGLSPRSVWMSALMSGCRGSAVIQHVAL